MSDILIDVSNMKDGSMSKGIDDNTRLENRRALLARNGVNPEQTVLVHLTYEGDDYRRYYTISDDQGGDGITTPSGITADALFTTSKNLALLLPIADCIGAVLHDARTQVIGLAHLGRHNLLQEGAKGAIEYMVSDFDSNAHDITVWLSPAAGRHKYPLFDFDNRSLHEVAIEQLMQAGIPAANIRVDSRDTTTDSSLFSHSEFLKGNRDSDGRQAVVCMMRF